METTTTTSTPTEEAYWAHPWEYAPIEVNGERYIITYYKYDYKVQPDQNSPTYEYIVEKSVEKTKVHVYGMTVTGSKIDYKEHDAYAYTTVVTPVKAASLKDKLTITVWFVFNRSEAFLYPWDVLWISYLSPTSRDREFVGIQVQYGDRTFLLTSPAPYRNDLLPYFEGDKDILSDINEDMTYLYMGWMATLHFGIWYAWENKNVLIPQSGVWSDMQGHSWAWNTKPDGTASFSGITFKLVDFEWKYQGSPEGVSMDGKGKFSPYLPLLVEGDGHYSYSDPKTGEKTVIYAYFKLEDLRLEKVSS
ncbi:hypothetical protein CDI07_00475 [Thermococcus sp. 5-4]|nr:hypothetical protein CDI07_00475 [Thermococcus sp. 5-4]